MPQFIYDWELWWLNYWHTHPLLFWAIVIVGSAGMIFTSRRQW